VSAPKRPRASVLQAIESSGVVAVVRLLDPAQMRDVAQALMEGGVRVIEVTMTVPRAVDLIDNLSQTVPADVIIGAGTVLDEQTATAVIDAGAEFVVSPVMRLDVVAACRARDTAVLPGCFTPTEIFTAWQAGADIVKVFPATALGPSFFKDMRGPLPQVRMMPTGGVTRENAGEWIRAGAVAIGVGTALVDPQAVSARQFDIIAGYAGHFIAAVQNARGVLVPGA
jgi:2-dehydro-3-deoxyphosphogluconate aldolase/(4S)-4-hydroxy-2-oxoglutarate aldolase